MFLIQKYTNIYNFICKTLCSKREFNTIPETTRTKPNVKQIERQLKLLFNWTQIYHKKYTLSLGCARTILLDKRL